MTLPNFEKFLKLKLNENKIFEAASGEKLLQAANLIRSIINKQTGKDYKLVPFATSDILDGTLSDGIMMYTDADTSAIRVGGITDVHTPGIVGSLTYFSDASSDIADFTLSSTEFPIVKLIGEFVHLMSDKVYVKSVQESVSIKEARVEPLTQSEIDAISVRLDAGDSVNAIHVDLGIPYWRIAEIKKGVRVVGQESPVLKQNTESLASKVLFLEETLADILEITRKIAAGVPNINSLFISGRAGTGKTYNVEKGLEIEGLLPDQDFVMVSGATSVIMMYKKLYQYKDKIVVFDDCDSVFADETGRNILKSALDTKKVRRISYNKKVSFLYDPKDFEGNPDAEEAALADGKIPSYFQFEGAVIFISNLKKDKVDPDGAIRSRSILIDVNPDDASLMERMRLLLPHLEPKDMPLEEKEEIFEFMKNANDISMRTFVKAAGFKQAGLQNWQRMAQRYL